MCFVLHSVLNSGLYLNGMRHTNGSMHFLSCNLLIWFFSVFIFLLVYNEKILIYYDVRFGAFFRQPNITIRIIDFKAFMLLEQNLRFLIKENWDPGSPCDRILKPFWYIHCPNLSHFHTKSMWKKINWFDLGIISFSTSSKKKVGHANIYLHVCTHILKTISDTHTPCLLINQVTSQKYGAGLSPCQNVSLFDRI